MNTITPVRQNVYTNLNLKKVNETGSLNTPVKDEFSSSVSFKGKIKTTTASKKGLLALGASALAALGFCGRKKVEQSAPEVQAPQNLIGLARAENPELANGLLSQRRDFGNHGWERIYSPVSVFTIVKYNKEDPKFAYQLAKILARDGFNGSYTVDTLEQAEYIAKKFKTNPEIVEKFSDSGDVMNLLNAHDENPDLAIRLYDSYYPFNEIKGYIELSKTYPEAVEGLISNPDLRFTVKDAENLAPRYEEDKDVINELAKCLKKGEDQISYGFVDLLDLYKENPEVLKSLYLETSGSMFNHYVGSDTPELLKIVRQSMIRDGYKGERNMRDVGSYIFKLRDLEPYMAMLEGCSLDYKMKILDEFSNEPDLLGRIIKDGRANRAVELASVYRGNPNKDITEDLIDSWDPIKRFFG